LEFKRYMSNERWALIWEAAPFSQETKAVKKLLAAPPCSACPPPSDDRFRYVFILTDVHKDARYTLALHVAVATLLRTCPKHGITVIWNQDFKITSHEEAFFKERGVEVLFVPPITWNSENKETDTKPFPGSEGGFFFKLHAWNQTKYQKVAVIDADLIIFRNIDAIFDMCTSWLCATREFAVDLDRHVDGVRRRDEWNAGFFVTTPQASPSWIPQMVAAWVNVTGDTLPYLREQKSMNTIFRGVQYLPKVYDVQFCNNREALDDQLRQFDLVGQTLYAIHAKFWKLTPMAYFDWALKEEGLEDRLC